MNAFYHERGHGIATQDITAKELLVINIETGVPTLGWDFGKQLLDLFAQHDKRLAPQFLYVWGKKIDGFSDIEDAQPHWARLGQMRFNGSLSEFPIGLTWRRRLTTKYQAEIEHEWRNIKGRLIPGHLSVYAIPHRSIDWHSFAERLYALTDAQYGFMHLQRDAHLRSDLSDAREPTWITGQRTERSVPQLGWSTFFGRPYADAIATVCSLLPDTTAEIQTTPIGKGIAVTLTGSLFDVADAFEEFDKKRAKAKNLFPPNFFTMP